MAQDEIDLTENKKEVLSIVTSFETSAEKYQFDLSKEDYEYLKALNESPAWKFYKRLLAQSIDAQVRSLFAESNPDLAFKGIGFVAGIRLAMNQLAVLCAEYDKMREKALEKKKRERVPFKRG